MARTLSAICLNPFEERLLLALPTAAALADLPECSAVYESPKALAMGIMRVQLWRAVVASQMPL